jgi:SpoIID/LytB domain protein
VYFGANTETDISTRAVMETDGIVALYNGDLILTLYSSTAGGYTESYSYAFSDPTTKAFPAANKPYLVAVPDKSEFEPLDSEEKAYEFYTTKIPSYDIESPYYRWKKEWAVGELENVLKKTLIAQSKTGFVSPTFKEGDDLGKIKDIKVMKRGVSGKVVELDLMTSKGCYRISKELVIRRVFQKDGVSLPSANVVFEKQVDKYGNITDITAYGGGFGHGVGMSQFGAGYMATKLNQPYYNILRHYYTGISLGTKPVTVSESEIKQTFWSPLGRAHLVISGMNIPNKIDVSINGKNREIYLTKSFFQKDVKVDISRYIEDGENTVIYHPASSPLKMYIELVEKFEKSEV